MVTKIGIYKDRRLGKWRVRWYGKYDPKTGRERRYSKTFSRKTDAVKFQEKKKAEFGRGVERDPSNETLRSYTERWLQDKAKIEDLRPATVLLYEGTFERLYDYFGHDRLLRQITMADAKSFLADLKPKNERIEPLSGWAKHRILRHCKTLFSEAVREGIVAVNPFMDIKGAKCIPSEWHYLKPDEFHRLLDVTPTLREKVLYTLAFTAGLRKTELMALCWSDIDFDRDMVRIANRKATEDYPPFYVKDTDARNIPLPKFTIDLLAQLQSESPENVPFVLMTEQRCQRIKDKWSRRREQGRQWRDKDWENNTLKTFKRRIRQAGIEAAGKKLTLHVLRKCFTQNMRNEIPENVALAITGHSSSDTANRFYSTVSESHLKAAAVVMDNLLTTDHKLTFSPVSRENQRV